VELLRTDSPVIGYKVITALKSFAFVGFKVPLSQYCCHPHAEFHNVGYVHHDIVLKRATALF